MVRLGYACINTVLRAQDVYTNRTLRLAKVKEQGLKSDIIDYFKILIVITGIEAAKELGIKNIKDLIPIIKLNESKYT